MLKRKLSQKARSIEGEKQVAVLGRLSVMKASFKDLKEACHLDSWSRKSSRGSLGRSTSGELSEELQGGAGAGAG